jgi:uncharacterized phage protein gp47/JayE
MTVGLTPEGWVPKTYAEIVADLEADQRAKIDPALDTSPDSVVGQQNAIVASKLAELWELGGELYTMLDPEAVTGAQQDALYSLTNTLREAPSKSWVIATVNLDAGTSIAAGLATASVLGNDDARFVNVEPMVNAGGAAADVEVRFEAEDTGPMYAANAGTLTVIETVLPGWYSITNSEDAVLGQDAEKDAAYRLRRQQELAAPGGSSLIGLRADLLRVPDVTAVQVLENTDSITDEDGMPPHSIEAVVLGGDDEEIAAVIYRDIAGGIKSHGSELETVTGEDGEDHEIRFSRPEEIDVYLAIEVEQAPGAAVSQADLKAALRDASRDPEDAAFLGVHTSVYSGREVCVAVEVPNVLNARVGLALSSISTPDDADALSKIAIGPRQIARLDLERMEVSVISEPGP